MNTYFLSCHCKTVSSVKNSSVLSKVFLFFLMRSLPLKCEETVCVCY